MKKIIFRPDHPMKIGFIRAGLITLLGNYIALRQDGDQTIMWQWPHINMIMTLDSSLAGQIEVRFRDENDAFLGLVPKHVGEVYEMVKDWHDSADLPPRERGGGVEFVNVTQRDGQQMAFSQVRFPTGRLWTQDTIAAGLITLLASTPVKSSAKDGMQVWTEDRRGVIIQLFTSDGQIFVRVHPDRPDILMALSAWRFAGDDSWRSSQSPP